MRNLPIQTTTGTGKPEEAHPSVGFWFGLPLSPSAWLPLPVLPREREQLYGKRPGRPLVRMPAPEDELDAIEPSQNCSGRLMPPSSHSLKVPLPDADVGILAR